VIDPARLKTQLAGLATRYNARLEAEMWGSGDLQILPEDLLPSVPDAARPALIRLAKQAQSIGLRIVNTKKAGTLGGVNWGGDNTSLDQALRAQDLDALAAELLEYAYYSGMIAGVVRRDPELGMARIEPLIGHVEPIYNRDSPTVVAGILHAWLDYTDGSTVARWYVRMYDVIDRRMLQWDAVQDSSRVYAQPPTSVVERSAEYPGGAPVPRFAILGRGVDRMPRGVIPKVLPLIKSDWSSQLRGDRAEENTAFSQLVVRGEVSDGTDERSPQHVIRTDEGGDAHYLDPASMQSFHEHHDRKLERLREDANMPGGFLGGGNTPSGEALREANEKFVASNQVDATRLARVLTELVADLAAAESLGQPAEVSVSINWNFMRSQIIQDTITAYRDGLVEIGAAVRTISQFFPVWEDAEVEAFIQEERAATRLPPIIPGQLDSNASPTG